MRVYAQARFCLHPWGDLATRRGFFDSVAFGCIPVLFSDAGYAEYGGWFGAHSLYTLTIPYADVLYRNVSVLDKLASLDEAHVANLTQALLAVRGRLAYSQQENEWPTMASPHVDATDVIVQKLVQAMSPARSLKIRGARAGHHNRAEASSCATQAVRLDATWYLNATKPPPPPPILATSRGRGSKVWHGWSPHS